MTSRYKFYGLALGLLFALGLVFSPGGFALATSTTTPTIGDTYIRQQSPTTNFDGGANPIYVGYRACCDDRTLEAFTLPNLTGQTITDVKLFLKTLGSSGTAVPADIYSTNAFTESTATWNNANTLNSLLGTITLSSVNNTWNSGSIGSGYSWGQTIYLDIKASATSPNSDWWQGDQKETSAANAAYLEITYTTSTPGTGTTSTTSLDSLGLWGAIASSTWTIALGQMPLFEIAIGFMVAFFVLMVIVVSIIGAIKYIIKH